MAASACLSEIESPAEIDEGSSFNKSLPLAIAPEETKITFFTEISEMTNVAYQLE